jgi:hypothetical protein
MRPVPIVTIDFGEGHTLQRTLNGNVATYICDPQGRVIDVIPGLCAPDEYVRQLTAALALYERSRSDFGVVARLHGEAAELARREAEQAQPIIEPLRLDVSKAVIEDPLKRAIRRDKNLLAEDGRRNLRWRKPIVHELLSNPQKYRGLPTVAALDATRGVRPDDIAKTVYRLALHVDLDDPYLGLEGGAFSGGAYGGFDLDLVRAAEHQPR